ncbi:MAG TPA: nuclear transport factor 2 family protein [Gemmatimonas sp.]|uniref:nuclear transport factor 2 family protein n=1 Tax=Gemmatimonas sp. TaxID=1962908 RepID=UPI002EDAC5EB
MTRIIARRTRTLTAAALALLPSTLAAQWSTAYEQFYLQAPHNWQFRTHYVFADRLFNAFDFGHAILYETMWRFPNAPVSQLETRRYDQLTKQVLQKPPRLPLEEAAIEPMYARLAPEAKTMFDWAHLLHRQLYDVLADERLDWPKRDAEVTRLIAYYRSRPDMAFSSKPKSMELMQEQPYSLAFRKKYPKFNGLIWGYHWFQVGLYEPLMVGRNEAERQAGVRAATARFFQMLTDAPRSMPYQMPMTAAVSPMFADRYPEAAIIFDNLHSMHDVVSDILANPSVPRDRKRAEIMLAAKRFRDDTSYVMTVPAWRRMTEHMGIENMGGPAVGFTPDMPTPSVTMGAVMQHDSTGAMTGFGYGGAASKAAADAHAGHAAPQTPNPKPATASPDPHAGHQMPAATTPATDTRYPRGSSADSAAAAAVVSQFLTALANGDSASVLRLLGPETQILERGIAEPLAEYRVRHLPGDIAFARSSDVVRIPRTVLVVGDVAYSSVTKTITGKYGRRPKGSAGAEVIVLSRGTAGWRIASVHWSSRTL